MSNAQVHLAPVLKPPDMPKKTPPPPHHANEPADRPDAYSALVSMHADEPYLPLTEAVLRCHAKRRLFRALAQAAHRPVADWLFADPESAFHQTPPLSNTLFDNALAIRATQHATSAPGAASSPDNDRRAAPSPQGGGSVPVHPGDDLLLVPARASPGRMLGYSFGGLSRAGDASRQCPLTDADAAFPPHVVGRFAFDARAHDLVVVMHGLFRANVAILHVRGAPDSAERERNVFLVPTGAYGFHRLPGRLFVNVRIPERRVPSMPRFQFAGGGGGGDARAALAALERVLKGKFVSARMCRDNFDDKSGEVLARHMRHMEAEFDARDAIGTQVLRDLAVRMYFSYMSSVARGSAAGPA